MDLFAGKADVLGRGRQGIPVRNGYTPAIIRAGNLATFLCRVVLVGEASPGGCFDGGSVGLRSAHLLQSTRQLFCEVFYRL